MGPLEVRTFHDSKGKQRRGPCAAVPIGGRGRLQLPAEPAPFQILEVEYPDEKTVICHFPQSNRPPVILTAQSPGDTKHIVVTRTTLAITAL